MPGQEKRVLISGASGMIGTALTAWLPQKGYTVVRLVRGAATGAAQIGWEPSGELSPQAVSGFDAVVHLAGETIAERWNAEKKRRIRDSRVLGTRKLAQALAAAPVKPRIFVCASAVGYYGNRGDELLRETSSSGNDFLSEVCREWEGACLPAAQAGIRTVQARTGLVLSASGGALPKMLLPFRLGLGGNMGSGRQWWSWIHIADWLGALHHVLENNQLQGPVNFVAPAPVTNAEFTKILAAVLSRPAIFPMPAFAARLAFGEMADALLLASQRAEPEKLLDSRFRFQFSELKPALQDILQK